MSINFKIVHVYSVHCVTLFEVKYTGTTQKPEDTGSWLPWAFSANI